MSDLIWLSEAQMRRIAPHFPLSHGVPRVDDRRVISGIIFVIHNGLRWRDGDHHALPHAAGHLKRITVELALGARNTDAVQHALGFRAGGGVI